VPQVAEEELIAGANDRPRDQLREEGDKQSVSEGIVDRLLPLAKTNVTNGKRCFGNVWIADPQREDQSQMHTEPAKPARNPGDVIEKEVGGVFEKKTRKYEGFGRTG